MGVKTCQGPTEGTIHTIQNSTREHRRVVCCSYARATGLQQTLFTDGKNPDLFLWRKISSRNANAVDFKIIRRCLMWGRRDLRLSRSNHRRGGELGRGEGKEFVISFCDQTMFQIESRISHQFIVLYERYLSTILTGYFNINLYIKKRIDFQDFAKPPLVNLYYHRHM